MPVEIRRDRDDLGDVIRVLDEDPCSGCRTSLCLGDNTYDSVSGVIFCLKCHTVVGHWMRSFDEQKKV